MEDSLGKHSIDELYKFKVGFNVRLAGSFTKNVLHRRYFFLGIFLKIFNSFLCEKTCGTASKLTSTLVDVSFSSMTFFKISSAAIAASFSVMD